MADDAMFGWAAEKLGNVMSAVASIADIAKDPETPAWYKRNLRHHQHRAFGEARRRLVMSA